MRKWYGCGRELPSIAMLLRQLRYFGAVAEQGSVVRAATALGVAQPALSRAIQNLEKSVGARLMDRGPRGVSLTAAGAALLDAWNPARRQLDDALRKVHLAGEGRLGTLRIGMARFAIDSPRLGKAFAALHNEFPDLSVVISELDSPSQHEALQRGELDLAVGLLGVGDSGLESLPLWDLRIDSVVLPSSHPLAKAESLCVDDLRDQNLLITGPFDIPPFSDLFDQLRRQGVKHWEELQSMASVYSFVAAGRGWTVAPGDLDALRPDGAVIKPLRGLDVTVTLAARWRRGEDSRLVANASAFLHGVMTSGAIESLQRPAVTSSGGLPAPGAVQIHQLRAFLIIGEAGSLSHAAQRLGMTQPGLSRQIRSLERDVGAILLRRRSNGVELTAAGELLRREAAQALPLIDAAVARARGMAQGISGRCSIATLSTDFTGELLRPAIQWISRQHPGISIEIAEMLSLAQIARLRERRIDIGICGAHTSLADEPLIDHLIIKKDVVDSALVSENHPLASRRELDPSDLTDVPFCFLDRASHPTFHDAVMEALGIIGLVPRVTTVFNGSRAMCRAAADLGGWALGNNSSRVRAPAGMVAIPIKGLQIPTGFQLVWRRDEFDPAVIAVLDALGASSFACASGA
jgi:DNA-binding transcriptional LysR family regulator